MKYECKGTRTQITKSLEKLKESIYCYSHLVTHHHLTPMCGMREKITRSYICDECKDAFSIEAYGAFMNSPINASKLYFCGISPEELLSHMDKNDIEYTCIEDREDPLPKYRQCAKKFEELGFLAKVECICHKCAQKRYPAKTDEKIRHYVFSFRAKGDRKWHCSFPSTKLFCDYEYRMALAFLNGDDTIQKLETEFYDPEYYPYDYMRTIKRVLCK